MDISTIRDKINTLQLPDDVRIEIIPNSREYVFGNLQTYGKALNDPYIVTMYYVHEGKLRDITISVNDKMVDSQLQILEYEMELTRR